MTGTVTGVTGYQWYAGGKWRVMSPNCASTWSPIPLRTRGVGWTGSRLSDRFERHRLDQRHERRTAVPLFSLRTSDSSRRRLPSKRSRRWGNRYSSTSQDTVVGVSRFTECRAKAGDFVVLQRN